MTAPVLLAGGYGVVGAQVARLLRDDDRLLDAASARGVPLVDVTRWTSLVHRSLARCAADPPRAPA